MVVDGSYYDEKQFGIEEFSCGDNTQANIAWDDLQSLAGSYYWLSEEDQEQSVVTPFRKAL